MHNNTRGSDKVSAKNKYIQRTLEGSKQIMGCQCQTKQSYAPNTCNNIAFMRMIPRWTVMISINQDYY